jgi:hypothetical protein
MEDELKEITYKIDRMQQEHERDRYNTHSYILFALAWSMLGLTILSRLTFVGLFSSDLSDVLFLVLAVAFFAWGCVFWFRARKVKIG